MFRYIISFALIYCPVFNKISYISSSQIDVFEEFMRFTLLDSKTFSISAELYSKYSSGVLYFLFNFLYLFEIKLIKKIVFLFGSLISFTFRFAPFDINNSISGFEISSTK